MLKKILLISSIFYSIFVLALPTIAVPDLKILPESNTSISTDNPMLTKAVVNKIPKFTADIRGALVLSGQFKVIDVKSMDQAKDSADDIDISQISAALTSEIEQNKIFDNCKNYVIAGMNSEPETTDLIAALAANLSHLPNFANKYVNQDVSGSSLIAESQLVPECQLQVKVVSQAKSLHGSMANRYNVNANLVKGSSILWAQNIIADTNTDYYLIGDVNYIGENEDSYPIKNTDNMTKQYVVEVGAEFKLVRKSDHAVVAAFTATGSGHDVKIVSTTNLQNQAWHHDIGKIVSSASKDLATNVLDQMQTQFKFTLDNEEKVRKSSESVVITDVKVYD